MNSILIASTAVLMDGRLLMIKEQKNEAGPTWNFPSGHNFLLNLPAALLN
ncbi:Uncharacterised protein [Mycobacteroides abscessus subsp. abscessus]|nr:Uncharacterised protein [Mycobacteroides abscessus subsp. abscessus]